jgi:uncharacterized protein (TIGR03083 family)
MSDILQRVESSWQQLQGVLEGIPDERMSEPGVTGDWSVKDVLAHIAYWEDSLTRKIERRKSGAPSPDAGLDVDAINAREQAARAGWSLEQARAELDASHARVLAALASVPDIDPDEVDDDTWEHYAEHADAIRAWRERHGI